MPQLFHRFIASLICSILAVAGMAQDQAEIDSLEALLPTLKGTEHIDVLNDLAKSYYRSQPDKTWQYASKANKLAHNANYPNGITRSVGIKGIFYLVQANWDSARYYFVASLEEAQKMGDPALQAEALNYLGVSFYYTGEQDSAMTLFEQSLKFRIEAGDDSKTADALNNMASIYQQQGKYETALQYYYDVLAIDEKRNNKYGIGNARSNIGVVLFGLGQYEEALKEQQASMKIQKELNDVLGMLNNSINRGNCFYKLKRFQDAVDVLQGALNEFDLSADPVSLSRIYNNLGTNYEQLNDNENALKYYLKSLEVKEQIDDAEGIAATRGNVGSVLVRMGRYHEAIPHLEASNELSLELQFKRFYETNCEKLALAYAGLGNYAKAYDYSRTSAAMKDSLNGEEIGERVAQLQAQFETEQKEREIAELKAQKAEQELQNKQQELDVAETAAQRNLFVGIALFLLVAAIAGFWINKQQQERKLQAEQLRQEQLRLKAVINTQEAERKRISSELHDGIGQLLSAVKLNVSALKENAATPAEQSPQLTTVLNMVDESVREVRGISHEMMPSALTKKGLVAALEELGQRISASGKLQVEVDGEMLTQRLNPEVEVNLYRIAQELLNNIVKYANANMVSMQFDVEDGKTTLMIEDDGAGFDPKTLTQGTGNGWTNIQSRLSLINGRIEVESTPGRQGTVAFVEISRGPMA